MSRRIVFFVLLGGLMALRAWSGPAFSWVKSVGGFRPSSAYGVAVDDAGNCLLAGTFGSAGTSGVIDFGTTNLTAVGDADGFLAKYSPSGECLWARQIGGTRKDEALKIAITTAGDAYVVGDFIDGATIGTATNLTGHGGTDFFVAKFNVDGLFQWAFSVGGVSNDFANSLSVDRAGNCYVTGSFVGSVDFAGTNLIASGGGGDAFLAKLRPNGSLEWVRAGSGEGAESGSDVAVDTDGNLLWAGEFSPSISFGSTNLSEAPLADGSVFVAKYNSEGVLQFARAVSEGGRASIPRIAVDSTGIYVAASYSGSVVIDAFTLPSGFIDVFFAKLSPSGSAVWVRTFGGNDVDACVDLVVDPFQNAYLVGHFRGTSTIGTNSITSAGNSDVLVASYGPNGGERWVWTAGGTSPDFGLGCALDKDFRLYLAGSYSATATFGGSTVTSPDILQKAFLARLDLAPTLAISVDLSQVHLSWPTNFSRFTLQTASTLNPTNWSESGASPRVVARDYVVSTNTAAASQLFRLRGP